MNDFSSRVPYALPDNRADAIEALAEILDIPLPEVSGDGTSTLQALAGTILYRNLEQRERNEVMSAIRRQSPRLQGLLLDRALNPTFVNPSWGMWSMTTEELQQLIERNERFQRLVTVTGANPGYVGGAASVWHMVKTGAQASNVAGAAASLVILGASEMSAMELNNARDEMMNRMKPANANADY